MPKFAPVFYLNVARGRSMSRSRPLRHDTSRESLTQLPISREPSTDPEAGDLPGSPERPLANANFLFQDIRELQIQPEPAQNQPQVEPQVEQPRILNNPRPFHPFDRTMRLVLNMARTSSWNYVGADWELEYEVCTKISDVDLAVYNTAPARYHHDFKNRLAARATVNRLLPFEFCRNEGDRQNMFEFIKGFFYHDFHGQRRTVRVNFTNPTDGSRPELVIFAKNKNKLLSIMWLFDRLTADLRNEDPNGPRYVSLEMANVIRRLRNRRMDSLQRRIGLGRHILQNTSFSSHFCLIAKIEIIISLNPASPIIE